MEEIAQYKASLSRTLQQYIGGVASLRSGASVPVYYFDLCWEENLELYGGLWAIPLVRAQTMPTSG